MVHYVLTETRGRMDQGHPMSPHGHRKGHPRGRCPHACRHRAWVEAYRDARALAEAEREAVTGHWPGDLARYATEGPPMPTLRAWMRQR